MCIKRNIHNRTAQDINSIMQSWVRTPDDQILLDIQSLLHSTSNTEVSFYLLSLSLINKLKKLNLLRWKWRMYPILKWN